MGGPPSCRGVGNSPAQRTHTLAQAPLHKPAERNQPEAWDKGPRDTRVGHSFLSPGLEVDTGEKGRRQSTPHSSGSQVGSPRRLEPARNSRSRAHPDLPIRRSEGVQLQRDLEEDRRPPRPPNQMLWRGGGGLTSERPGGGQTPTQTFPIRCSGGGGEGSDFRETWRWTDMRSPSAADDRASP